ncbi:hypothetical protein [Leptolyngbya sp. NIES-2104]|uniref:hypothetical protein n=1 Tax=Leptolyngbya sp. NIES-2104 TaxID=1552121 RepID=UPI00073F0426|nr:hypothetical protein [Leptolyngbya sp. NIES-2104]
MSEEFKTGDRIQTPTGRTGVIIESDADFPNHCLIQFDSGQKQYVLRRILQRSVETKTKLRKK